MKLFPCFVAFALIICSVHHVFSESEGEDYSSYTKHCSSVIPPHNATTRSRSYGGSLPSLTTSHFTGGYWFEQMEPDGIHNRVGKDLRLRLLPDHYRTTAAGVYKVEGFLYFSLSYRPDDVPEDRRTAGGDFRFPMNGFWSEKSRKLCMVGSTSLKAIDVGAVLKLKFDDNDENPTIHTAVVSGSFESTASAGNPAYFDPILIFSFTEPLNYSYSLVSDGAGAGFPSRDAGSLSLDSDLFCLVMERWLSTMEMEYAAECEERPPPRRCSLLHYLPNYLSLNIIQCEEKSRKARFLATFGNYSSTGSDNFPAGSTAVGEAWWDAQSNRINGVACLILNPSLQLGNAVGDCTIRLSLNYPSVLTLRNDARIEGAIWSSQVSDEDSGYFRRINLSMTDDYYDVGVSRSPDQRYIYKYTELDRARKSCSHHNKTAEKEKKAKTETKTKGNDGKSDDMIFDLNIKSGDGRNLAWAKGTPAWVENFPFKTGTDSPYAESEAIAQLLKLDPARITYRITMHPSYSYDPNANSTPNLDWPVPYPSNEVVITAEGLYDGETGHLCMVGCRKLIPPNSASAFKDCEIVVEVEMPVLGRESGGLVKGIIRSTRPQTDPLHFDDMMMESTAYDQGEAERSVWRMDIEIAMVVTSNALICIFVVLQIFHLKRNPEAVSSVSLVMLVILCAGLMIPLVLNFEEAGYRGRLEANEVAVRVIGMVTLLLQLRLLQLVYAASKQRKNSWWSGEIMAGFVSFSLYVIGGLLTLVLSKTHYDDGIHSIWSDLRCYGGLILDGFLLPQILLNVMKGSASGEKGLCRSFYVGTSAVRLVPHVYNQYRSHNYPEYDLYSTYYYANPAAGLYSTAWDIAIPCGIVAFAVIVFLQQRNGGRCFLPRRCEKSGYT